MIERTLILLKPDSVRRGLVGEILSRFERAGLKIVAMKMQWVDEEFAKKHYREEDIVPRRGEQVWRNLLSFITEGPVVAAVLEGVEAVEVVRKMCGSTEPKKAAPGTIRGDYSHHSFALSDEKGTAVRNVIHASSSKEDAELEVKVWFKPEEIHSYKRWDQPEHYGE